MAADLTTIFDNFSCKTFHTCAIVYIYHAHCIPFNKNKKIDERRTKKCSLNTAHSAVVEGSAPTCHFITLLRMLRS